MTLRFITYYHTTNPDTIFSNQWTTETGQGINHTVSLATNSHIDYAFVYIYGMQAGANYNFVIQKLRINDSYILKQAYIQGSERNIDIKNSFSGTPSAGYSANFDVSWTEGASRIVIYFENPNAQSETVSSVSYKATYINAINIGNGQATAVNDIQNNTTDIKNDTTNIFTSILELPQKIYDKILELFEYVFIPDPDEMKAVMDDFSDYIEGRLGFIGQSFNMGKELIDRIRNTSASWEIPFPDIKFRMNNTEYVLYRGGTLDFKEILGGGTLYSNLILWARTITSILMVLSLINMGIKEMNDFLSNRSEL